jgi:hypothetical protein
MFYVYIRFTLSHLIHADAVEHSVGRVLRTSQRCFTLMVVIRTLRSKLTK